MTHLIKGGPRLQKDGWNQQILNTVNTPKTNHLQNLKGKYMPLSGRCYGTWLKNKFKKSPNAAALGLSLGSGQAPLSYFRVEQGISLSHNDMLYTTQRCSIPSPVRTIYDLLLIAPVLVIVLPFKGEKTEVLMSLIQDLRDSSWPRVPDCKAEHPPPPCCCPELWH